MSMGLNFTACISSCTASRTRNVASVQISISFWRRSSSVMMPRSNCVSTFSASSSKRSSSDALICGVRTSEIAIVSAGAGRVLEAELLQLVEALGHDRTRVELDELARQLREVALAHRASWNGKSGGNASLNMRRPSVVYTSTLLSPLLPLRRSTIESGCSSSRSGNCSTGNRPAGIRTLMCACSDTPSVSSTAHAV